LEDPGHMVTALADLALAGLGLFAPLMLAMAAAAMAGGMALGGWNFSTEALGFKPERLHPVKGLGRMFGLNSLVEVGKASAKALLILAAAVGYLWFSAGEILGLSRAPLTAALGHSMELALLTLLIASLALLLIAAVDAPWQLF